MTDQRQANFIRPQRVARGWSQQDLADRCGLSRAGISAIESGRLAPSVHGALAIAHALGTSVEELFQKAKLPLPEIEWAIPPTGARPRYWNARVADRVLAFPIGEDAPQLEWHDALYDADIPHHVDIEKADRTLVVASCDPAAGLLAAEYTRQFQFRMIALRRNSSDALSLLAEGKVHAAGVHLGRPDQKSGNIRAARARLGKECQLVRVATWEEGLALAPSLKTSSIASLAKKPLAWVGREIGSGARQCQDEVLGTKKAPKQIALDHRMVASAIKCGWAEVGPCVRLAAEEAGLSFFPMHEKDFDMCFRGEDFADPRISALLATLRSRQFRTKLAELPGYRTNQTGEQVTSP